MKKHISFFILTLILGICSAQKVTPDFSYDEYIQLLYISAYQVDTPWNNMKIEYPKGFTMEYRSEEIALLNRWDLWVSKDSLVVISIRGTVGDFESWLENFYAAMVPASGTLKLSETETFDYKLSTDSLSAVHTGWLLAFAYLQPDIEQKLVSYLDKGYTDFIITGHSQGGAIAFLVTADIWLKKNSNYYQHDFNIKTYCSAAPKPGNINFAREYEYLTQHGYAYNVVNAADWVPETPITVQTLNDFNEINPISNKKQALKNQGFITRLFMGRAYGKIDKPLKKTVKRFKKYLGKKAFKYVKKSMMELEMPDFTNCNYYVRTGNTITLYPDSAYNQIFSKDPKHKFVHHMLKPYLYLAEKQKKELFSFEMTTQTDVIQEEIPTDNGDSYFANAYFLTLKLKNTGNISIPDLESAYFSDDFEILINDTADTGFYKSHSNTETIYYLQKDNEDNCNWITYYNSKPIGNEFTLQYRYFDKYSKKLHVIITKNNIIAEEIE